jgi:pimeloyl-ACP methyl ester carboxylesterase
VPGRQLSSIPDTGRRVPIAGGRRIGLADVGDPHGKPVLYFPGGGDSRLTRHPDDSIAAGLGVRVLAVERPGCGLSDRARRRTLAGWAQNVEQLADALALDRFGVLGWSAGGPHALAVAAAVPERVTSAVVVAGLPLPQWLDLVPEDLQKAIRVVQRTPFMAWRPLTRWGERPIVSTGDAECDRVYAAGRVEAFRRGPRWLVAELRVLGRPWGFELGEIRTPVTLWYGTRDNVCPPEIGRRFEHALPNARLVVTDDGHQLLFSRWRELLSEAAARASA